MWTQLNILVTSTATPLAEQLMTAKTGVSNVLSVQLVPIGSPPGTEPTWFGGSGAVATELVPLLTDAQTLADEAGIDLAQAEWLLGAESDITLIEAESWASVLERLGLEVQQSQIQPTGETNALP